jgi:flagellar hook-basal body protein
MVASVDSSGKADLNNLNVLAIPPKTIGQAVETTQIQMGLNLPADSAVITADFDRTNPETYNKSTALTVYDSGGNGYLATVYYAKTASPSIESPFAKWQTYFFVGDTEVKPALQQATDAMGSKLFVNKYGDVLPKGDPRVVPSSGTTEMFSLDELTDVRTSTPAKAVGAALPDTVYKEGVFVTPLTGTPAAPGPLPADVLTFSINVDGAPSSNTATPAAPILISYTLKPTDKEPQVLARQLEIAINNAMGVLPETPAVPATPAVAGPPAVAAIPGKPAVSNARFGITVAFDPETAKFSISSGTTGDSSSISISTPDANASKYLGLVSNDPNLTVATSAKEALRGKPSEPAVLRGDAMTINTTKSVLVTSANNDFLVSVDGVSASIELPFPTIYTNIEAFTTALQDKINAIVDPDTGRKISGVKVGFDAQTKQLNFTTATTGNEAAIQVSGSAEWGLADTEMQFGMTTDWKKLTQFTQNGAPQYVKNGEQTEDLTGLSDKTAWWPVYLDRGELSFDLTGKVVSPLKSLPFETTFLQGGKGALTMSIDFTKSTQYSSAFSVLSQSQDGAPEGGLMGLNIGADGLVTATYSNGSQSSLGKIVLANFSTPSGLRQVGDASYLADAAASGEAKIGEAGSAGFGSVRAGATERSNVDLTQELVDLITAQRNFQANAKAIETSSTMTNAIINIRS